MLFLLLLNACKYVYVWTYLHTTYWSHVLCCAYGFKADPSEWTSNVGTQPWSSWLFFQPSITACRSLSRPGLCGIFLLPSVLGTAVLLLSGALPRRHPFTLDFLVFWLPKSLCSLFYIFLEPAMQVLCCRCPVERCPVYSGVESVVIFVRAFLTECLLMGHGWILLYLIVKITALKWVEGMKESRELFLSSKVLDTKSIGFCSIS